VTRLRIALIASAAFALMLAVTATARSGLVDRLVDSCPGQQPSQPFLPWLDLGSYTLAGDGAFETGATGWRLMNGATVVPGNEPWHVHAVSDSHALYLPTGAGAVSPPVCIGLLHPTARFFARSSGGALQVDVRITLLGVSTSVRVGVLAPGSSFAPTLPMPLLANITSPLAGSGADLVLTFTAVGGPVTIDDVYVDPFKVN
jgi:hypothetical protein